jgi:hypothetical protein
MDRTLPTRERERREMLWGGVFWSEDVGGEGSGDKPGQASKERLKQRASRVWRRLWSRRESACLNVEAQKWTDQRRGCLCKSRVEVATGMNTLWGRGGDLAATGKQTIGRSKASCRGLELGTDQALPKPVMIGLPGGCRARDGRGRGGNARMDASSGQDQIDIVMID